MARNFKAQTRERIAMEGNGEVAPNWQYREHCGAAILLPMCFRSRILASELSTADVSFKKVQTRQQLNTPSEHSHQSCFNQGYADALQLNSMLSL